MLRLKDKIFKNSAWLIGGEGVSRFFLALTLIYAARILGAEQFGVFSFALAFCSIFLIFSNAGLSDITTRELAKNREREKDYSAIISLKTFLTVATFGLIFLTSFFVEENIRKIIWIIGIYVVSKHFLVVVYAFFRARQKMKYEAWIKIIQALITLFLTLALLSFVPSVAALSYALMGSIILTVVFVLILFSFFIRPISFSLDFKVWKRLLKLSWPLGLTTVFAAVYIYIDSIMMGFWGQIVQVGWYNASYRVIGVLMITASLIGASFFSSLSKLFNQSMDQFYNVFRHYLRLMMILALGAVIIGIPLSPHIIDLLYGEQFLPAVLALQILIVMAALYSIYNAFYLGLIAANQQKKVFWISFIAALTNIIFNFILIPKYSLYGAASATLITYIVLLVLSYQSFKHYVKNKEN
jgi:O-antigen/teichoic acid export membrane protein